MRTIVWGERRIDQTLRTMEQCFSALPLSAFDAHLGSKAQQYGEGPQTGTIHRTLVARVLDRLIEALWCVIEFSLHARKQDLGDGDAQRR